MLTHGRLLIITIGALLSATTGQAQDTKIDDGGYTIKGQVVDRAGKPIAGALVTTGIVPTYFERRDRNYPETDDDGRFRFKTPFPPPFTLSVYHRDFIALTKQIGKQEGDEGIQLTLTRGESLRGGVKADPATLASLWATAYFPKSGFEALAKGNERGSFQFRGLPVGKCVLTLRAENLSRTSIRSTEIETAVLPGMENRVAVALPRETASLSGKVEDAQGNPLKAKLVLHIYDEEHEARFSTKAGADGKYTFDSLPTGAGQLLATATGKASRLIDVDIEYKKQKQDPLQLGIGAPVRFSLVNVPPGTAQVELRLFFGKLDTPGNTLGDVQYLLDQPLAQTGLTRNRSITLNHVDPGAYTLRLSHESRTLQERGLSERRCPPRHPRFHGRFHRSIRG